MTRRTRFGVAAAALSLLVAGLAGCTSSEDASAPSNELRLGYFPNITHATALVGVERGTFADELGDIELKTQTFNAGPTAIEAIFGGGLDATYIGPNPAVNAFVRSNGDAIRIIGGATSGGAQFVVQPEIDSAEDLRGQTVSSPQLGNTQDVALRFWLQEQGLETSVEGGGDVTVLPQENASILTQFQAGDIAGAWVPEAWASRLIIEGKGKVLVDEADEFPNGEFVTTHLIVRRAYLEANPDAVASLLRAHVATNAWIAKNDEDARDLVNGEIDELTGKPLAADVLARAWANISTTNDPIPASLATGAAHAAEVGITDEADLNGIYDLSILNRILREDGDEPISAGGLGKE
jgi:NitT/TauT family transport system substrate-binding protein